MSKRAKEAALKAYPGATRDESGIVMYIGYPQYMRNFYIEGYEQAEKDMIERACEWLLRHYAVNLAEFRKAMEE